MPRRATSSHPDPTASPEERLNHYRATKDCIPYYEDLPDRDYPHVKCSIFGVPSTNELYVQLANGCVRFVERVPSPLDFPVMADRVFGIDAVDANVAFALADRLWEQHSTDLIPKNR